MFTVGSEHRVDLAVGSVRHTSLSGSVRVHHVDLTVVCRQIAKGDKDDHAAVRTYCGILIDSRCGRESLKSGPIRADRDYFIVLVLWTVAENRIKNDPTAVRRKSGPASANQKRYRGHELVRCGQS